MKKITIIILLITNLYSLDDLNQTSLDMFLFKIGFKSLASDVEIEKNNTKNNKIQIEMLKKQVQSMLDMNSNNKFSKSINLSTNIDNNDKIHKLEEKVKFLQKQLNEVLKIKAKQISNNRNNNINIVNSNKTFKKAHIGVDSANVYISKNKISKILYTLKRDDNIKVEYCTKYGWCKLYKKNGFIAKYRLIF